MSAKLSKRNFIQAVGGFAGIGAVLRSMETLGLVRSGSAQAALPDLAPGSGAGKSIVILGAGIAGLAAAYELSKAGYGCTVLEASGRVGGRSLTVRAGDAINEVNSRQTVAFRQGADFYANLGPARIPYHHRAILGYCKRFAVPLEVFTNDNRAAFFHDEARFGGQAVTARRVVSDLHGYIAELLAKAVSAAVLDSALTATERRRLLEMLSDYGDLDDRRLYRISTRGGFRDRINAGLEAGAPGAPLDFAELLESGFWNYNVWSDLSLNQSPTLLQPVGGMDSIVKAFERRVGAMIRYRSIVTEIRNSGLGVRVVYRNSETRQNKSLEADFAICTIPAPILATITSNFSPETRSAISAATFGAGVKIAFQTRRRFWEDDHAIYGGITWTGQDITQIWYPPHGYHGDGGIILGAYAWDEDRARFFEGMDPAERLRVAVAQGERVHPGYASEIENGVSRAWGQVPFQEGAWPMSDSAPEELRRPDGAVFFAGDQVSALPGWQEGAILAAHAAVAAINEKVTAQ